MVRSFAVVPAAGRSERMGAPKLLLPVDRQCVIDHVLAAWTTSGVTRTVVVVRADDAALIERCRQWPVELILPPEPPHDMRSSVELALSHISQRYSPAEGDVWLVAPADLPQLSPAAIDMVLAAYDPAQATAIAPTFQGRRGHPTLLPWPTAGEVAQLAAHEGVNALVARTAVREIECSMPGILDDIDAPADYARLTGRNPPPTAP